MGFSDMLVEGYRYNSVTFSGGVTDEHPPGTTLNALQLRDHGLNGGEIYLSLGSDNEVKATKGIWYASKCFNDLPADLPPTQDEDMEVIGTIKLHRMSADGAVLDRKELPLEALDEGHLLDRLVGEVLSWHAETYGVGPFKKPKAKRKPR